MPRGGQAEQTRDRDGGQTVGSLIRGSYIRKIETAAGFTIIDRAPVPLIPTARGREFLREALQILQIARESADLREASRDHSFLPASGPVMRHSTGKAAATAPGDAAILSRWPGRPGMG